MRRRLLLARKHIVPPSDHYLRVAPSGVQWITTETPVIYDVETNAEWRVR